MGKKNNHGLTPEERPYPYETSYCSGVENGWTVEARYVYPEPKVLGKQIFDNRWRAVDFQTSPIGIPACNFSNRFGLHLGLLPYESAQALRWWFIAQINEDGAGALCMETRIVKHRVEYTLSSKAVSSHDNLGGDLARYNHSCPIDLQGKGREITDADNPTTGE